jgi:hypothetical protein
MPSTEQHQNQYLSNKQVIGQLNDLDPLPYDWIITIHFYAALHLVEKKLAQHQKHNQNHKERNRTILSPLFRAIAADYMALYNESQSARYNCSIMTEGKVKQAAGYLTNIERQLA